MEVSLLGNSFKQGNNCPPLRHLKPFVLFSISFVIAWIYVLIPVTENYWFYEFVKTQWFVLFAVIVAVETQDFCLPDASYPTYFWSYLFGFILPPLVTSLAWSLNLQNNYYMIVFAHSSLLLPAFAIYFVDASFFSQRTRNRSDDFNISSDIAMTSFSSVNEQQNNGASERKVPEELVATSFVSYSDVYLCLSYYTPHLLLPRSFYARWECSLCSNVKNRLLQWFWSLSLQIMFNMDYTFLMNFTSYCKTKQSKSPYHIVALFVIFVLVSNVLRFFAKRIGRAIDNNKEDQLSLFTFAEVLCLFFYYTFYRLLFESIPNFVVFVCIEVIHLSQEWLFYGFRSTHRCAHCIQLLIDWGCPIDSLKESDLQAWQRTIALDYGIRCVIMISTAAGVMLLLLTIDYMPWTGNNALRQTSQASIFEYISIALGLEVLNACVMINYFFKPQGHDVGEIVLTAFQDPRFSFVCCIAGGVLFINPMVAFTAVSFNH